MRKTIIFIGSTLIFPILFSACESNKLPEPVPPEDCDAMNATYSNQMKDIIDNSCAYAGCHDGAGGIGPHDFTNYQGMEDHFKNFHIRVIEFQDDPIFGMPPDNSFFPQSQKDRLTQEELQLFECWIDAGFPEN